MKDRAAPPVPNRTIDYFSERAFDYQYKSSRFPWAWVRARELSVIRRLLGNLMGNDVLELGAGAGFYARDMVARGARHVWAVDICGAMLATLPSGPITHVLGDAETVRLDRRFPVLLSAGLLEFVQNPAAVLTNAAQNATPDARFVLLVPHIGMFGKLYQRFHHAHSVRIRLFDKVWFEKIAPRAGWRIHEMIFVPPFSLAVRLSRLQ